MAYKTVQVTLTYTYQIDDEDAVELYGQHLSALDILSVQKVDGSLSERELLHNADYVERTFKFVDGYIQTSLFAEKV